MKRLLRHRLGWLLMVIGLAAGLVSEPAAADQKDPRLDALFERLASSDNALDADVIEADIWRIWLSSGDAELDGRLELGQMAMAVGDLDTAIAHFTQVIERAPGFAEGWNKRATAYYLRGDLDASMADVRQTLALEPRHFGAISGIGLIFLNTDDPRAALDAFERVLTIHPFAAGAREQVERLRRVLRGLTV